MVKTAATAGCCVKSAAAAVELSLCLSISLSQIQSVARSVCDTVGEMRARLYTAAMRRSGPGFHVAGMHEIVPPQAVSLFNASAYRPLSAFNT